MMQQPASPRSAAQALVDQLIVNRVRHVFCVPGESYLAVLDALRDRDITITVCRQEGGRGDDGRGGGQGDRAARRLLRHPRPRRHQRLAGRPHRPPELDAR